MGTEVINSQETFATNVPNKQENHDGPSHKQSILQIENKILVGAYQPVARDNSLEQLSICTEIELVNEREGNVLEYPNVNVNLNDIEKWIKKNVLQEQKNLESLETDSDSVADSTRSSSSTNSNKSSSASSQTTTNSINNEDQSLDEDSISSHNTQTISETSADNINNNTCDEKHFDSNIQQSTDSTEKESEKSTIELNGISAIQQQKEKSNKESENASTITDSTESTVLYVPVEESSSESSEDLTTESPLDLLPTLSSKQLVREWLNSASVKSRSNVYRSCKACAFLSAKKYEPPKFNKSTMKRDFATMSKSERISELERIYGRKLAQASISNQLIKRRPKWKF